MLLLLLLLLVVVVREYIRSSSTVNSRYSEPLDIVNILTETEVVFLEIVSLDKVKLSI